MTTTPPHRPRRRGRRIVAVLLGLLLVFLGYHAYRWATAEPAPVVDYFEKVNDLVQQYQPEPITDENNAWPLLVKAAQQAQLIKQQVEVEQKQFLDDRALLDDAWDLGIDGSIHFDPFLRVEVSEDRLRPEFTVLQRIEADGLLDDLRRAAELPTGRRTFAIKPTPPLIGMMLPSLSPMRELASTRAAAFRLAAAQGDTDALVVAFDDMLAIGRHQAHQCTIIDRLVGIASISTAFNNLRRVLRTHRLDAETAAELRQSIDRQVGDLPPVMLQLRAERCFGLDLIQYLFSDDGHGDGTLSMTRYQNAYGGAPTGAPAEFLGRMGGLLMPGRRETTDQLEMFYDLVARDSDKSLTAMVEAGFESTSYVDELSDRQVVLRDFLPDAGRLIEIDHEYRVIVAAMRIMLAIEEFRALHDTPPASLDDLTPDILAAEALLDPANGQQFVYVLLTRSFDGHLPYVLYSMGADGHDDNADVDFEQMRERLAAGKGASMDFSTSILIAGTDLMLSRRFPE